MSEVCRQRQCLRMMKRFPEVRLGPARGVAALYDVTVRDIARDPVLLDLPRAGVTVDTRFLSRLRGDIQTTGSVIG